MFSYVWPIALVVLSNVVYQICAKSVPDEINPFASLTVTYLTGAAASLLLFLLLGGGSLTEEYSRLNGVPFLLGVAVVGLEAGYIYAYKAGWPVSSASIVQSAFLAAALVLAGAWLYREPVTWNKLVGIAFCMIGLIFINHQ